MDANNTFQSVNERYNCKDRRLHWFDIIDKHILFENIKGIFLQSDIIKIYCDLFVYMLAPRYVISESKWILLFVFNRSIFLTNHSIWPPLFIFLRYFNTKKLYYLKIFNHTNAGSNVALPFAIWGSSNQSKS